MLRRVAHTVARYDMLRAGDRVGVAVSGGPDSVALLLALGALTPELGLLLGVVHLNHGWRGAESDADEQFSRDLAASLGLDFIAERAPAAEPGENLEQAGRRLRLEFFRRLLAEQRFDKIALGHTRTDQAETVLYRFLRGATTAGLSGIHPVLENRIVRPLLEVERAEVLEYLTALGQAWREDATNRDLAFDRNRLRHQLLPQLEKEWNPGLTGTLAHLADWAREEENYWRSELEHLAPLYLRREGRAVLLEAPQMAALAPAVERRLLRFAIEQVKGDLRGIGFEHLEQIRRLTSAAEGHGRVQIPGVDVFRSFDQVRLAPLSEWGGLETRNFSLLLEVPGTYEVPQTETRFILRFRAPVMERQEYNEELGWLDWDRTPRPLWLRNWRPGDRLRPRGAAGEEKLKSLFQSRKVPLWQRRSWPVVASQEVIVWSREFGVAAEFAAGQESRTILEILEAHSSDPGV